MVRVKTILVSVFCTVAVLAQKPGVFEVTSVKANRSGEVQSRGINIEGARIVGENLPLRTLIQQAYGVLDFQIDGGPKWIEVGTRALRSEQRSPIAAAVREVFAVFA